MELEKMASHLVATYGTEVSMKANGLEFKKPFKDYELSVLVDVFKDSILKPNASPELQVSFFIGCQRIGEERDHLFPLTAVEQNVLDELLRKQVKSGTFSFGRETSEGSAFYLFFVTRYNSRVSGLPVLMALYVEQLVGEAEKIVDTIELFVSLGASADKIASAPVIANFFFEKQSLGVLH